ncbi:MAG: glycosyltransferase family 2 protein [Deltaproteobacteria bacterium]|nr:glycosyltransferase family 2 protein [Deltaproteobacteria bacterium]
MSEPPKVTVVIPVYNREKYVRDAIDSIVAQTFTDFELFVIDDGSTDGSQEVVRSYCDPRIRLVCNEINQGIPKTRNTGIRLARGEYLAFLDSDDWACPERLRKQVAFLDGHPDYVAVGAWIEWMDEEGRPLGRIKRKPVSPEEIAAQRLFQSGIENSASMARTGVLRNYGHQEQYDICEDFDLWSRIAAQHKLATLPEVLGRRRIHSGQVMLRKASHKKDRRLEIYAAQLHTLGVAFTDTDLERHFLLRSMRKLKFTPDLGYLNWAEAWLQRLQEANRQALCYPEPTFSEMLGRFWLKVCWYASTSLGWTAWRRFWGSPLRRSTWQGLRKFFFQYSTRSLPRGIEL